MKKISNKKLVQNQAVVPESLAKYSLLMSNLIFLSSILFDFLLVGHLERIPYGMSGIFSNNVRFLVLTFSSHEDTGTGKAIQPIRGL